MQLRLLAARPENWNSRIETLIGKTLFHESSWLDYVQASYPHVTTQYLEMQDGQELAGYLCVMRATKVMYTVWGSPLQSIGMYSGPLIRPGIDQQLFMRTVVEYCRKNGVADFELCNAGLDPNVMEALGFQAQVGEAFETPLEGGIEKVWEGMRGICRTRIRKAEKNGLVAELVTDPEIVSIFYRQFELALRTKGLVPEYGIDRPRALFEHLQSAGRLFSIQVRYEGKVIGSAFYPHDDQTMYFWDSGYDPDYLHLSPNELLHWAAMKEGIARGLTHFNIGGAPSPSLFTRKFGGNLIPYVVYQKSFDRSFSHMRSLYRQTRKFGKAIYRRWTTGSVGCMGITPLLGLSLALLLSTADAAHAGRPCAGFKDEWKQCETAADCELGESACRTADAYNRKFAADIKKYNECIRPAIRCAKPPPGDELKTEVDCRANVCVAVANTSDTKTRPRD